MYLASVNKTPFTPVFDTLSDLKDNTYNPKDTVNYKYNFKRFGVWFFFFNEKLVTSHSLETFKTAINYQFIKPVYSFNLLQLSLSSTS